MTTNLLHFADTLTAVILSSIETIWSTLNDNSDSTKIEVLVKFLRTVKNEQTRTLPVYVQKLFDRLYCIQHIKECLATYEYTAIQNNSNSMSSNSNLFRSTTNSAGVTSRQVSETQKSVKDYFLSSTASSSFPSSSTELKEASINRSNPTVSKGAVGYVHHTSSKHAQGDKDRRSTTNPSNELKLQDGR